MIEYTVKVTDEKAEWYFEGNRHRLDGPAIECANGRKEWWVEDRKMSEVKFNSLVKVKELSVKEIEKLLGYPVKVIKE